MDYKRRGQGGVWDESIPSGTKVPSNLWEA